MNFSESIGEEVAFIDAVFAAYPDRTPLLIYCDWLDDNNNAQFAAFLRACATGQKPDLTTALKDVGRWVFPEYVQVDRKFFEFLFGGLGRPPRSYVLFRADLTVEDGNTYERNTATAGSWMLCDVLMVYHTFVQAYSPRPDDPGLYYRQTCLATLAAKHWPV